MLNTSGDAASVSPPVGAAGVVVEVLDDPPDESDGDVGAGDGDGEGVGARLVLLGRLGPPVAVAVALREARGWDDQPQARDDQSDAREGEDARGHRCLATTSAAWWWSLTWSSSRPERSVSVPWSVVVVPVVGVVVPVVGAGTGAGAGGNVWTYLAA